MGFLNFSKVKVPKVLFHLTCTISNSPTHLTKLVSLTFYRYKCVREKKIAHRVHHTQMGIPR